MPGRGRGFLLDTSREVRAPYAGENPVNFRVVAPCSNAKEQGKDDLKDWDPMKEAYNDSKFNSYSEGLGKELFPSHSPRSNGRAGGAPEPGKHFELYITGIPLDMDDTGLKNLFSKAGKVKKAKVMETKNTRIKGTFGFVGFDSTEEVQRAIQMFDDFRIKDTSLRVQLSKTKEEKEAEARRREELALMGQSANRPSSAQYATSGYESASGRGPRDTRNASRGSSSEPSSISLQQKNQVAAGVGTKPQTPIVVSSEPIHPGPCLRCGKLGNFRCKNCKGLYCGMICQREDWKKHRKTCIKSKRDRDSGNDSNKENDNIIKSGPLAGFEILIPGDDEMSEIPDARPVINQKKANSRVMLNEVERERLTEGKNLVKLVYMENAVSYTFHISKNARQVEQLQKMMQETYGTFVGNSRDAYVPIKDELVAAFYHVDNSWYRAEVLNITGAEARIKFVDFGNEEQVSFNFLRKGCELFKKFRIQGISVSLAHYIFSKEALTESDIQTVRQVLIMEAEYRVTDVYGGAARRDSPFVQLEDLNGVDIGRRLADAGVITSQQTSSIEKPISGSAQKRERLSSSGSQGEPRHNRATTRSPIKQNVAHPSHVKPMAASAKSPPQQMNGPASGYTSPATQPSPQPEASPNNPLLQAGELHQPENPPYSYPTVAKTFQPGRDIEVTIAHLELTRIWIQEICKAGFLEQLTQDMTAYYDEKPLKKDYRPTKTCLTAARFPIDQMGDDRFYRAHVFNYSADGVLDVCYLDFGNSAKVTFKDIHNLESVHLKDEFQAVPICLADLDPTQTFPDPVIEQLKQLLGTVLKATVVSSTNHTAVLDITLSDNRRLTDVLIECGAKRLSATSTAKATPLAPSPSPVPVVKPSEPISLLHSDLQDGANVVITWATDINCLYVADPSLLEKVANELTTYYKEQEQCNPEHIGQFVVAFSLGLKDFFRVKILKMKPQDSKAKVYYVDYGNTEILPFSRISKMTQKLAEYPMLAVKCSLGVEVKPGKTIDASLLGENNWMVKINAEEDSVYTVDLLDGGKSLRDHLIKQDIVQGLPKPDSGAGGDATRKASVPLLPSVEPQKYNEPLQAMVTDATNFDSVYIQLLEPTEYNHDIVGLSKLLQTEYAHAPSLVSPPKKGDFVVAQFSEDGLWYRAEVKTVGERNAFVRFIDYGNAETVDFSKMKTMSETAAQYKIQAMPCYLHGVMLAPGTKWDFSYIPSFTPLKVVFLKCCDDKYEIKLLGDKGEDLAEGLQSIGVFIRAAEAPALSARAPAQSPAVAVTMPKKPQLPPMFCPQLNVAVLLECLTCAPSCEEIYLISQDEKASSYSEVLASKLNATYGSRAHTDIHISEGDLVVAKSKEFQEYYRALVKKVDDGVEVFYVDYGNSEKVSLKDIEALMPEFLQYPRLALCCTLENVSQVPGAEWPSPLLLEATHFLVKNVGDGLLTVDLLDAHGGSLREKMIDQNIIQLRPTPAVAKVVAAPAASAAPVAPSPEKARRTDLLYEDDLPPVEEPEGGCMIMSVNSPVDFYVQIRPKKEAEDLLLGYLHSYCHTKANDPASKLSASDIVPGLLVAGKFTDGVYYRGVVKRKGADNSCDVFFVDFGNMAMTTIHDLLPLDRKLAGVPPLAVKVSQIIGIPDQSRIPQADLEGQQQELTVKRAERLPDGSFAFSLVVKETGQDLAEVLGGGSAAAKGDQPDATDEMAQIDAVIQLAAGNPELLRYLKEKLSS